MFKECLKMLWLSLFDRYARGVSILCDLTMPKLGFFAFRVINLYIFDIVWLYYINIMLNMHHLEPSYQMLTSNNSCSVDVWPILYIYRYLTFRCRSVIMYYFNEMICEQGLIFHSMLNFNKIFYYKEETVRWMQPLHSKFSGCQICDSCQGEYHNPCVDSRIVCAPNTCI